MNHHDASISEVIIILHEEMDVTFEGAITKLIELGVVVGEIDKENCGLQATIDSTKLKSIEQLPFVKYIRRVFEYTADYPPGDPRNLDPDDDDGESDVDDGGI